MQDFTLGLDSSDEFQKIYYYLKEDWWVITISSSNFWKFGWRISKIHFPLHSLLTHVRLSNLSAETIQRTEQHSYGENNVNSKTRQWVGGIDTPNNRIMLLLTTILRRPWITASSLGFISLRWMFGGMTPLVYDISTLQRLATPDAGSACPRLDFMDPISRGLSWEREA